MSGEAVLTDSFDRVMRDLRISVTDRCNFRCVYCLPETEEAANFYRTRFDAVKNPKPAGPIAIEWKPRSEILTFEEIERIARVALSLGIKKIRITGGEPLLRQGVDQLIGRIASMPGVADLAMTTNGFAFLQKAMALQRAGLRRVSFSLDSMRPETFKLMTGRDALATVLAAIRKAVELGFAPVKINAVVIRNLNDQEIEPLTEFALGLGAHMRFIEFMPLDSKRAWLREMVVPGREILDRLRARFRLEPLSGRSDSETARRYRVDGGTGEVGVIAPVTEPFCGHCNRIRLTADGKIRTCLFSVGEYDLRALLRGGGTDADLAEELARIVLLKEERHHIGEQGFAQPSRSMSCIGG